MLDFTRVKSMRVINKITVEMTFRKISDRSGAL